VAENSLMMQWGKITNNFLLKDAILQFCWENGTQNWQKTFWDDRPLWNRKVGFCRLRQFECTAKSFRIFKSLKKSCRLGDFLAHDFNIKKEFQSRFYFIVMSSSFKIEWHGRAKMANLL
jgi:hypothetical protein